MQDKFKDFFSRVIADIDCQGSCNIYEREVAMLLKKSFETAKESIIEE